MKRRKALLLVGSLLLVSGLSGADAVAASGVRVHGRVGWGDGWYRPAGGFHARPWGPASPVVRHVEVRQVNSGTVDFNVEPQESQLFVDGAYFGIADDFNGWPQSAQLPAGWHNVRIVSPSGRTETRRIYVAAGRELNFNLKF
jgi:hypothetical protein